MNEKYGALGSGFKKHQATKQFNTIWDNRKVEKKLYLLPFGPNKIVYLFSCLIIFKSAPCPFNNYLLNETNYTKLIK